MFYAEAILARKGPLAKVWLAAHWERKITKMQFLQTNIPSSVNAIVGGDQPPLSLRLSGQLLLGVVRIHSRKARYLLEDCNEALLKIKMAFRPGVIDMPSESMVAATNAITLPDALTEFDLLLPVPERQLDWMQGSGLEAPSFADATTLEEAAARNTSRLQDITLADVSLDASAIPRAAAGASALDLGLGAEDLLGRDDEFQLNLEEPMLLSPVPHELPGEESTMEVEVPRDMPHPLRESMVGIGVEGLPALGEGEKLAAEGAALADISLAEAEIGLGLGDELQFQDEFDVSYLGGADRSMALLPTAEESALLEAEAEVLAPQPAARPRKRRAPITDRSTMYSPEELQRILQDTSDICQLPSYIPPQAKVPRVSIADSAGLAARSMDVAHGQLPGLPPRVNALFGRERPLISDFEVEKGAEGPQTIDEIEAARGETRLLEEEEEEEGEAWGFGEELRFEGEEEALHIQGGPLKEEVTIEGELAPEMSAAELEKTEQEAINRSRLSLGPGISLFVEEELVEPTAAGAEEEEGFGAGAPGLLGQERAGAVAGGKEPYVVTGFSRTTVEAMRLLEDRGKTSPKETSDSGEPILSFNQMTEGVRRQDAVKLFFETLVLKTKDYIDVSQPEPFGDIQITLKERLHEAISVR